MTRGKNICILYGQSDAIWCLVSILGCTHFRKKLFLTFDNGEIHVGYTKCIVINKILLKHFHIRNISKFLTNQKNCNIKLTNYRVLCKQDSVDCKCPYCKQILHEKIDGQFQNTYDNYDDIINSEDLSLIWKSNLSPDFYLISLALEVYGFNVNFLAHLSQTLTHLSQRWLSFFDQNLYVVCCRFRYCYRHHQR